MQRLGIFGGTFDPIHHAHLAIANEAQQRLALDQVVFMPTAQQPLKQTHSASAQQRLALTKLAIQANPAFTVSELEIQRAGVSYTFDTVQALQQLYPMHELWLIVGADSIHTLPRWHKIEQLMKLVQFVVFERPQHSNDFSVVLQTLPNLAQRMTRFVGPHLDLSATELRQRCANDLPIRYLVPDAVAAYIEEHDLYRTKNIEHRT